VLRNTYQDTVPIFCTIEQNIAFFTVIFWMKVISKLRWQAPLPKIEENKQSVKDTWFTWFYMTIT